ncbi:hypothetical protein BGZ68_004037, partial [Mortierella alpina]
MFAWQNNEAVDLNLTDLEVSLHESEYDTAKFDLFLAMYEANEGISGDLIYATALFDNITVEKHVGYLREMLQAMILDAELPLATINILSSDERNLLDSWNNSVSEYPDHLCLHSLFEQQVERTPEAVALVHGNESLTYMELNTRANRLAHHLVTLGVRPDALVAICVQRSFSVLVGILAILKAGGAYVPLDPSHASSRLSDILLDAAPVVLVADSYGLVSLQGADLSSLT